MNTISAVVITFNEEKNIEECIKSLNWADEIIIVDSHSNDDTVKIAKKYTTNITLVDNIPYGLKRNIGFDKAKCDWIIWIDADERITGALKNEILSEMENGTFDAYYINRKSFFINKFINHCGWYPDFTLRLFRKSAKIKFNDAEVHEKILYAGKTGKLKNDILHYTNLNFEHYVNKLNSYTTLSANELARRNRQSSIVDMFFRPVFTFLKMYFAKLGFLDGYTGLILSILSSYHVFFKYAKNNQLK